MKYINQLAAANYNCENTDSSAYGEGGYGTCATTDSTPTPQPSPSPTQPSAASTSTTTPGAPNTGFFSEMVSSGALSILLPLAVVIIAVTLATILTRKKRLSQK